MYFCTQKQTQMKTLITITCLLLMANASISQETKHIHDDTFYELHLHEQQVDAHQYKMNESTPSNQNEFVLRWEGTQKIDKVILVKEDHSEFTFIGGEIKEDVLVKNLSEGIYYVGYYFNNVCISRETIVVGNI